MPAPLSPGFCPGTPSPTDSARLRLKPLHCTRHVGPPLCAPERLRSWPGNQLIASSPVSPAACCAQTHGIAQGKAAAVKSLSWRLTQARIRRSCSMRCCRKPSFPLCPPPTVRVASTAEPLDCPLQHSWDVATTWFLVLLPQLFWLESVLAKAKRHDPCRDVNAVRSLVHPPRLGLRTFFAVHAPQATLVAVDWSF